MTEVCEHGHQRRKCEVCELTDEIVRLREAVLVLAKEIMYDFQSSGNDCLADWLEQTTLNNQIAYEAVRKASDGNG